MRVSYSTAGASPDTIVINPAVCMHRQRIDSIAAAIALDDVARKKMLELYRIDRGCCWLGVVSVFAVFIVLPLYLKDKFIISLNQANNMILYALL